MIQTIDEMKKEVKLKSFRRKPQPHKTNKRMNDSELQDVTSDFSLENILQKEQNPVFITLSIPYTLSSSGDKNKSYKHRYNYENIKDTQTPTLQTPTPKYTKKKKIILFDMDETLGYFTQFGVLCDSLYRYYNQYLPQQIYNKMLDIYEYYLRPNILTILKYLIHKKQIDTSVIVAIFTNNADIRWVNIIKEYFHYKLQADIFDDVILLYEKENTVIEERRTSNEKRIGDIYHIFQCSKDDTEIVFVDDMVHKNMIQDNVYYIHITPYVFHYTPKHLASLFLESFQNTIPVLEHGVLERHIETFVDMYILWDKYEITIEDRENSKKIMQLLQKFFQMKQNKTRRVREKSY
jgi:hypothetical protein